MIKDFMENRMGEIIAITSGKGGVGKTTFAINIGCGLALMKKKVLIIDENNGLRNLEVAMGLSDFCFYNFIDFINGKKELNEVVVKDKRFESLYVIPAAQIYDENCLDKQMINYIYSKLKEKFDYIIIDTPCGVSNGFISSVSGADKAIIISTPDIISIRNADKIKSILLDNEIRNIALIFNKIDAELKKKKVYISANEVDDLLGLEVIDEFDYDINFPISFSKGEPLLLSNTESGRKIATICENICGGKIILPVVKKKKFKFFRKK